MQTFFGNYRNQTKGNYYGKFKKILGNPQDFDATYRNFLNAAYELSTEDHKRFARRITHLVDIYNALYELVINQEQKDTIFSEEDITYFKGRVKAMQHRISSLEEITRNASLFNSLHAAQLSSLYIGGICTALAVLALTTLLLPASPLIAFVGLNLLISLPILFTVAMIANHVIDSIGAPKKTILDNLQIINEITRSLQPNINNFLEEQESKRTQSLEGTNNTADGNTSMDVYELPEEEEASKLLSNLYPVDESGDTQPSASQNHSEDSISGDIEYDMPETEENSAPKFGK